MCQSCSTIHSYAPNITLHQSLPYVRVQTAGYRPAIFKYSALANLQGKWRVFFRTTIKQELGSRVFRSKKSNVYVLKESKIYINFS